MNVNTSKNKDEATKLYWSQAIIVIALFLVFVSLVGISVISLSQTEQAYQSLNDPLLVVWGFAIGNYISILFALVTQYSQNAALYIKKHFCKNQIVFKSELLIIGDIEIRDNQIADFVFWVSAGIDALTNIIWFYTTVAIPVDIILGTMLRVVGYGSMVASVFAEEAMGIVLDAFRKAKKQLDEISKWEKKLKLREASLSDDSVRVSNRPQTESDNKPSQNQSNNNQSKKPADSHCPPSQNRQQDGRQQPQYRPLGASSKDDEREMYRNES
jgi:hypothetical protein